MFTGIVQGKATVIDISRHPTDDFVSFAIEFPANRLDNVSQGASIAINGTCLTVTEFDLSANIAQFDVIGQTLAKTNLGMINTGDSVNFERAAKIGDEIGGHQMSGHIWETATISNIIQTDANTEIQFTTPAGAADYILEKGYIGLNGCSLTIAKVSEGQFSVCLIPETLSVTTFGEAKVGDEINVEVDPQTQTIVETVKKYLSTKTS